ncbi:17024_t:CDS:2, partial [Funneliformis geosporum]
VASFFTNPWMSISDKERFTMLKLLMIQLAWHAESDSPSQRHSAA